MEADDWVVGKFGSALNFDGVNEYVEVTDPGTNSVLDITDALTIAVWVKPTKDVVDVPTRSRILTKGNSYLVSIFEPNKFYAHLRNASGYQEGSLSASNLPFNKWYHLVMVWDGYTAKGYLNGEYTGYSFVAQGPLVTNDTALRISNISDVSYFKGLIDEVRIYNYARTPEQILQDYNAGLSAHFK